MGTPDQTCSPAAALDGASASVAGLDTAAAVQLAQRMPLLRLHLNNFKHPANPVLVAGAGDAWDAAGIERVATIRLGPRDWRLWYANTGPRRSLGLATSTDGVQWTKYAGNPVFEATAPWEEGYLSPSSVLWVDGLFYLYYWAPGHVFADPQTGRFPTPKMKYIALATSRDGIHWTRQGELDGRLGAVLGPEPAGLNEDAASGGSGVDAAKVFYFPEQSPRPWRMIYTAFGRHGQWNGLADSADGIVWRRTAAPVANHSGNYHRATGNHHDNGQTIRCPIRCGSLWAGLSFELDTRDSAPALGLALDRWIVFGGRTLYANQDYERGALHPWCIEADPEWYYLYYSTGQSSVGLIRAPRLGCWQPVVLWESQTCGLGGQQTRTWESDGRSYALHLTSDEAGELTLLAADPTRRHWLVVERCKLPAGLTTVRTVPPHAQLRLQFQPTSRPATVSAWLVPRGGVDDGD